MLSSKADSYEQQHHGHFDKHSHDRRECRAGLDPEQRCGRGDGDLDECMAVVTACEEWSELSLIFYGSPVSADVQTIANRNLKRQETSTNEVPSHRTDRNLLTSPVLNRQ